MPATRLGPKGIVEHFARPLYSAPIPGKLLAVDTETTGLRVHKGHRPFLYNFANDQGDTYVVRDDRKPQRDTGMFTKADDVCFGPNRHLVRAWMGDPSVHKVFHNSKFDLRMMRAFGIEVAGKVDDTMVMAHTLSAFGVAGKDFGFRDDQKDVSVLDMLALDFLAKKFLREEKDPRVTQWLHENPVVVLGPDQMRPTNYSDVPDEIMLPYARQDVVLTMKLFYMMNEHLDRLKLRNLYEDEMALLREVVVSMEERGARLDVPFMRGRLVELKELSSKALDTMRPMIKPIRVVKVKTRTRNKVKFKFRQLTYVPVAQVNFGSDRQMAKVLQYQFGLVTEERTKTGQLKMDERNLSRLDSPFAKQLVRWRQYEKLQSTYFGGYLERANGDVLHPNYLSIGTLTGRFSSRDPNLTNIPTEKVVRERAGADVVYKGVKRAFIPRDGYVNYHADYSQIEMKMMAVFAHDAAIDKAVMGRDIHTEITKLLYGNITDPKEFEYKRVLAKIVSFGLLYGMSRKTFMWKLKVDERKVDEILTHYFTTFPGIKRFQLETSREVRETGQVRNLFGRRYLVDPRVAYRAVNYRCQGSAADLIKKAMLRVHRFLRGNGLKSNILLMIHDELIIEVHESEDKWLPRKLIDLMQDVPESRLPIKASLERADGNWENLHKVCLKCGESKEENLEHVCPLQGRWPRETSSSPSTPARRLQG